MYADILQVGVRLEFVDYLGDILVDKIRASEVDEDYGIRRHILQLFLHDGFIQKAHVFTESYQVFVFVMYDHNRRAEIAS